MGWVGGWKGRRRLKISLSARPRMQYKMCMKIFSETGTNNVSGRPLLHQYWYIDFTMIDLWGLLRPWIPRLDNFLELAISELRYPSNFHRKVFINYDVGSVHFPDGKIIGKTAPYVHRRKLFHRESGIDECWRFVNYMVWRSIFFFSFTNLKQSGNVFFLIILNVRVTLMVCFMLRKK